MGIVSSLAGWLTVVGGVLLVGAAGTYLVSNSRWRTWIGAHDDTDGPWSQAFGSVSGFVGVVVGLAVLLAAAALWAITLTVK